MYRIIIFFQAIQKESNSRRIDKLRIQDNQTVPIRKILERNLDYRHIQFSEYFDDIHNITIFSGEFKFHRYLIKIFFLSFPMSFEKLFKGNCPHCPTIQRMYFDTILPCLGDNSLSRLRHTLRT